MLVQSVRRVPPPKGSSSQRLSKPPQLYSSTLGASARVTVVSVMCGAGAPTVVSFTVVPTVPRLPSASKGAHSRRCAGSVSACQTFPGEWRSSRTRMSVHLSSSFCTRSFRTCAPLAGPGVYCSRSVIFFSSSSYWSWSSFSLGLIHGVEVACESIYVSGPEPTERSQPGSDLLKWFRFQPVETALCVRRGFDETGVAQHSQVL